MHNNRNPRRGRLSVRPFYATVFILSLLTAYSFLAEAYRGRRDLSSHDDASPLLARRSDPPSCSEIHAAEDQCAFARQYCAEDSGGLLPYLTFYYCTFSDAKALAFIVLVTWLGLLFTTIGIAASDFFSVNLGTISQILGLSESLAGVTFLAFGNGSPDVFSTFAAMSSNSASMAVGELIGAACFITGVVAGSMALVREFQVDRKTYARDICFFIVAVAFTAVFLADGHLHFWECSVMIGYYVLYVVTVVSQHWFQTRRKRRLRREGEARSHVYGSVGTAADELAGEPYRDEPDTEQTRSRRSDTDISVLENGPRIEVDGQSPPSLEDELDEEAHEDHDRMVAAEVASNMRVLRTGGKRRYTLNPIRPSLVGALEFRSALAHLQRESNLKLAPIQGHGRSLSVAHIENHPRRQSADENTSAYRPSPHTISVPGEGIAGRTRALSSGDEPPNAGGDSIPYFAQRDNLHPPQHDRRSPSPGKSHSVVGGNLAPPAGDASLPGSGSISPMSHAQAPDAQAPNLHLQIPSRRSSQSGGSSPRSPFPVYSDSPAMLTPLPDGDQPGFMLPGPIQQHQHFGDLQIPDVQPKPVRWWPYSLLPPPHILYATLFPTIQGWKAKTAWDKIASTVSLPSVFLLVITLPVVETDPSETDSLIDTAVDPLSRAGSASSRRASLMGGAAEEETEWERYQRHALSRNSSYHSIPQLVALENEDTVVAESSQPGPSQVQQASGAKPVSEVPSMSNANDETLRWNRWLVCIQLFTGPLFAAFILWANMREDLDNPGMTLVKMMLYTIVLSLILLAALLSFTTEHSKPKYHYVLCFLGFIISIAWISTIAEEVVGVLKTLGVVLNISEALLGLTIFAAGNSVGDLVADITVARLGFPVMALSACFGGPMLNILLGIGIGGVLMMVQGANKQYKKHPDMTPKYGPYPIEVGGTLMISAITLLVILLGLLVAVPMNKWVLSRRIGWVLIALWTVSTSVNVVVELTGAWGESA